ncbi:MAG: hypothetical protein ACKOEW_11180, partial [Methylocystis sp.]
LKAVLIYLIKAGYFWKAMTIPLWRRTHPYPIQPAPPVTRTLQLQTLTLTQLLFLLAPLRNKYSDPKREPGYVK